MLAKKGGGQKANFPKSSVTFGKLSALINYNFIFEN